VLKRQAGVFRCHALALYAWWRCCCDVTQVEGTLVAAGTLGLLRLCQRLLPCKPEAAELLLRGLQLVPSVDPEVWWSS
jgi:hypothetical protein